MSTHRTTAWTCLRFESRSMLLRGDTLRRKILPRTVTRGVSARMPSSSLRTSDSFHCFGRFGVRRVDRERPDREGGGRTSQDVSGLSLSASRSSPSTSTCGQQLRQARRSRRRRGREETDHRERPEAPARERLDQLERHLVPPDVAEDGFEPLARLVAGRARRDGAREWSGARDEVGVEVDEDDVGRERVDEGGGRGRDVEAEQPRARVLRGERRQARAEGERRRGSAPRGRA